MKYEEINHEKKWKYAKLEIERRFLLLDKPLNLEENEYKIIEDKYLKNTRLRLRKTQKHDKIQYKLTKKLPVQSKGKTNQWISTIYLSKQEYLIFSILPGIYIKKRRYYYPSELTQEIGIDEINLLDKTIWIAEIEFEEDESSEIILPFEYAREITQEEAYAGSELAKQYAN